EKFFAVARLPHLDRAVETGRSQTPAVRAKGDSTDSCGVSLERQQLLVGPPAEVMPFPVAELRAAFVQDAPGLRRPAVLPAPPGQLKAVQVRDPPQLLLHRRQVCQRLPLLLQRLLGPRM